jgi:hypothetical protein
METSAPIIETDKSNPTAVKPADWTQTDWFKTWLVIARKDG